MSDKLEFDLRGLVPPEDQPRENVDSELDDFDTPDDYLGYDEDMVGPWTEDGPDEPGDPIPEINSSTGDVERDLEITLAALDQYRQVFEDLTDQLAPGIFENKWQAVVGDDASGRLPALFFGRLLTRYAREHGLPAPKRLFVSGGAAKDPNMDRADGERESKLEQKFRMGEEAQEYAQERAAIVGQRIFQPDFDELEKDYGRALIVTEHIHSGGSVERLVEALGERRIACDVVTLSDSFSESGDALDKASGASLYHVYVGHSGINDNPLFHRSGGLRKIRWETEPDMLTASDILAEAKGVERIENRGASLSNEQARGQIKRIIRHKIQQIADDCYDQFLNDIQRRNYFYGEEVQDDEAEWVA